MSHALGMSFGLGYISVSRARENGTVEHIGSHATGAAYQELFQHVLAGRVQSNFDSFPADEEPDTHLIPPESYEVKDLIRRELEKVLGMVESCLDGGEVEPAICVPDHWNSTVRSAVFEAAEGAKMPLAGTYMLLKLPRALEKAYQLDAGDCGDDYYFIVVDYNATYLHLHMCETAKDGGSGIVESQVQLSLLGETSASEKAHSEKVLESIRTFLSLTTAKTDETRGGRIPYHEIKAVILNSCASAEGMQEMRRMLRHVFEQDSLCDSRQPHYAAADGAARAAKLLIDDPKSTRDFVSMPDYIPQEPQAS